MNSSYLKRRTCERGGVAILMVIAFYAIAITLIGTWVSSALRHKQQLRLWHEKTQVTWLAKAGVNRATARLTANAKYDGELWAIPAAVLGGNLPAEVVIRIEPGAESPEQGKVFVHITSVAVYPAGGQHRVQSTMKFNLTAPQTNKKAGDSL